MGIDRDWRLFRWIYRTGSVAKEATSLLLDAAEVFGDEVES